MDKPKLQEYSKKLFQLHIQISGFYNDIAKSPGMTLTAYKVLHIIYKQENCTQQEITKLSFLPKQTVNAIIQTFVKNGIVNLESSDDIDKRNKIITFTQEGRKIADSIISKFIEAEYYALNNLGEEKIEDLIEIVTLYKDNLKKEK